MTELIKTQWKRLLGLLQGLGGKDDDEAEAEKPAEAPASADPAGLRAAIKRIRDTSRWIVLSFAAIAALIVGTAPLDKVGNVEAWSLRFWIAAAAFAVVVGTVAAVIGAAAAVDGPAMITAEQLKLVEKGTTLTGVLKDDPTGIEKAAEWIRLAELADVKPAVALAETPLAASGEQEQYPAPATWPIAFLSDERDRARDALVKVEDAIDAEQDPTTRAGLEAQRAGKKARFTRLDDQLGLVLRFANYYRLNRRFNRRKRLMIPSATLAAVAIVAFIYAIDVEKPKSISPDLAGVGLRTAVGVDFQGAQLAGAQLAGADLRRADLSSADLTAADLAGANLKDADLSKANLSAADLRDATGLTKDSVKDATWVGAVCPDRSAITDPDETCNERLAP